MAPSQLDVIVCGHNEAAQLGGLFESFRTQTGPSESFRLIFVDNASTDATAGSLPALGRGLLLTCLQEPRLGKSFALNTGIEAATTSHVAFIDADCRASPTWIQRIKEAIAELDPDLLGGPFYPYYSGPRPPWYKDAYNTYAPYPDRRRLDDGYLRGANLVCRRQLLVAIGGFSAAYQIAGRHRGGGEDTELQIRARAWHPGLRAFYDPAVVVHHLTRATHMSVARHCRRRLQYGLYFSAPWATFGGRVAAAKSLLVSQARILRDLTVGLLFRDRRRYPFPQNHVYEKVGEELFLAGLALGRLRRG